MADDEGRVPLIGASVKNASERSTGRSAARIADGAGVIGAVLAALCCAGAPIIVSVLAATGLGFLRNDAILLPFMGIALVVALWGFLAARRVHGAFGPLATALVGTTALVAGVVFIHGFPAKPVIGVGTALLLGATIWNARVPAACGERASGLRS